LSVAQSFLFYVAFQSHPSDLRSRYRDSRWQTRDLLKRLDQTASPNPRSSPRLNDLLAALSSEELERVTPLLRIVRMRRGQAIYHLGEPIRFIYFPLTVVLSLVGALIDGRSAEIGIIGNEGMVGLPAFFGPSFTAFQLVVQIPGTALRMPVSALGAEARRAGSLDALLLRYSQTFFNQVAQGLICNRYHTVAQRLATWLLMIRDRVDTDRLPLTQEFLGYTLGVGRPSVTIAEGTFAEAGLVRHTRGAISIVNRAGLEAAACECYFTVRDDYQHLGGVSASDGVIRQVGEH
jgi:CRP-like cAMP-binding protein